MDGRTEAARLAESRRRRAIVRYVRIVAVLLMVLVLKQLRRRMQLTRGAMR